MRSFDERLNDETSKIFVLLKSYIEKEVCIKFVLTSIIICAIISILLVINVIYYCVIMQFSTVCRF